MTHRLRLCGTQRETKTWRQAERQYDSDCHIMTHRQIKIDRNNGTQRDRDIHADKVEIHRDKIGNDRDNVTQTDTDRQINKMTPRQIGTMTHRWKETMAD